MNKSYVGVRVETIKDYEDLKNKQHHNYRKTKNKRIVNNNGFYFFDHKTNTYKNEKSFNSSISKERFFNRENDYTQRRNLQKSKNKNFHSKRTKSLSQGILYFSEGINKDFQNNKKEFFKKIDIFRKEFQKKYNTEIIDFLIHNDEEGNIHIHFIFKNFNIENGSSLNFTRNKNNGSELQTFRGDIFQDYGQGYQRGEIKEEPSKHLSIEEFKLYQDTKKENLKLKEENEKLLKENQELKENNNDLNSKNDNLLKSINKNILEHYSDMKEFYEDLVNLLEEENEIKFFKNLERYFNNRRKTQLKKHINKMEGKLQKIKKKKEKELNKDINLSKPTEEGLEYN